MVLSVQSGPGAEPVYSTLWCYCDICHHKHVRAYSVGLSARAVRSVSRAFDTGSWQTPKTLHLER